jgi:hypothetical protein
MTIVTNRENQTYAHETIMNGNSMANVVYMDMFVGINLQSKSASFDDMNTHFHFDDVIVVTGKVAKLSLRLFHLPIIISSDLKTRHWFVIPLFFQY